MELMTVLMDMLIFYLLPIVIIYIAIDMQYVACVHVARIGLGDRAICAPGTCMRSRQPRRQL